MPGALNCFYRTTTENGSRVAALGLGYIFIDLIQLFDLQEDPWETRNLAFDEEYRAITSVNLRKNSLKNSPLIRADSEEFLATEFHRVKEGL